MCRTSHVTPAPSCQCMGLIVFPSPPALACFVLLARNMEDLQLQLARTTADLRRVQQDLRRVQRRKREPLAPPRTAGPTVWSCQLHCALAVWALQNDVAPALQFISQKPIRQPSRGPSLEDDFRAELAILSEENKTLLLHPTTNRGRQALAQGQKFLAELDLHSWVRGQNTEKGLAPSNKALWRRWAATVDGQEPLDAASCREPLASSSRGQRQWLRRWKRRWDVCKGRFKTGDKLPLEFLRAKVCKRNLQGTQISRPGPSSGPRFEFQIPDLKMRPSIYAETDGLPIFRAQNKDRDLTRVQIFGAL